MKIRVDEGSKTFGALKMMFFVMNVSWGVKREFYEKSGMYRR